MVAFIALGKEVHQRIAGCCALAEAGRLSTCSRELAVTVTSILTSLTDERHLRLMLNHDGRQISWGVACGLSTFDKYFQLTETRSDGSVGMAVSSSYDDTFAKYVQKNSGESQPVCGASFNRDGYRHYKVSDDIATACETLPFLSKDVLITLVQQASNIFTGRALHTCKKYLELNSAAVIADNSSISSVMVYSASMIILQSTVGVKRCRFLSMHEADDQSSRVTSLAPVKGVFNGVCGLNLNLQNSSLDIARKLCQGHCLSSKDEDADMLPILVKFCFTIDDSVTRMVY